MDKKLPDHVAVIMDGNRRWAAARNLNHKKGHEAGADSLERIVKAARKFGVKYLTVFALSSENLKERSSIEINYLFALMGKVITAKAPFLDKNNVRLNFIGDLEKLPTSLMKRLTDVETKLKANNKLVLTIAINYGGRAEIVAAVRGVNKDPQTIEENDIAQNLFTALLPDPDLIIRTGGQRRLSNFLTWQSTYAELYFTDTLWPDFSEDEFKKALADYGSRLRNFGS